jgi:hypothetical protein
MRRNGSPDYRSQVPGLSHYGGGQPGLASRSITAVLRVTIADIAGHLELRIRPRVSAV